MIIRFAYHFLDFVLQTLAKSVRKSSSNPVVKATAFTDTASNVREGVDVSHCVIDDVITILQYHIAS